MENETNFFLVTVFDAYQKNVLIYYFANILTSVFVISFLYFLFTRNETRRALVLRTIPPLLLSAGIFGTFVGIFYGLLRFDTNKIDASIFTLLDGLKIAFFTSIMGMAYSLIFRFGSVLVNLSSTFRKSITKDEGVTAEDLLSKLTEIKDAISGDQDSSLITQIQKLRTDTLDNLKQLNTSFSEFAKEVAENNTKSLIEAIEQVMKDFNTKINEQIGDNFKRLNEGVEKLVTWQDNYKEQVEKMVEQFNLASQSIEKSKDSMVVISERLENIPDVTEKIQSILETNQNQISNLEGQLDAFNKMKDNATEAMPQIEKRLNEMTDTLNRSISGQMDNLKNMNDNMKSNIETTNESIKNAIYEQLAAIKTVNEQTQESIDASNQAVKKSMEDQMNTVNQVNENMKNSIETSNEAIKNAIQGVVDDTSQKLVQQIEALDKQMSEELSRALELMGSKLTSLSNQFVKDYEPLTKQLSSLVQSLNQRSQSPESDN